MSDTGTTRRIAVVSAGLSQPSSTRLLADRIAEAARRTLLEHGEEADVEVIELREHAHAITDQLLTGFPGGELRAAREVVARADAVVAVTPIFNASFSGLFKSFFDVLDEDALVGKPVVIAATGGTARHSLALEHALRPMFSHLRAVVVPTAVFAASEDWASGGVDTALRRRIDRAADELAALTAGRRAEPPADPFDTPTPFEELLRSSTGG